MFSFLFGKIAPKMFQKTADQQAKELRVVMSWFEAITRTDHKFPQGWTLKTKKIDVLDTAFVFSFHGKAIGALIPTDDIVGDLVFKSTNEEEKQTLVNIIRECESVLETYFATSEQKRRELRKQATASLFA